MLDSMHSILKNSLNLYHLRIIMKLQNISIIIIQKNIVTDIKEIINSHELGDLMEDFLYLEIYLIFFKLKLKF